MNTLILILDILLLFQMTTMISEEATDYPSDEARTSSDESRSSPAEEEDSTMLKFFTDVWDVVRMSVSYAGRLISELTTRKATEDAAETEPPTTERLVTALSALEEPASHHRLPAQEFEKGGRDIDALFYGRGIEA